MGPTVEAPTLLVSVCYLLITPGQLRAKIDLVRILDPSERLLRQQKSLLVMTEVKAASASGSVYYPLADSAVTDSSSRNGHDEIEMLPLKLGIRRHGCHCMTWDAHALVSLCLQ
jgi:hypothetical protein